MHLMSFRRFLGLPPVREKRGRGVDLQREKLSCDAGPVIASFNLTRSSGAKMVFQAELGQDGHAFAVYFAVSISH